MARRKLRVTLTRSAPRPAALVPLADRLIDQVVAHYDLDEPEARHWAIRRARRIIDQCQNSNARNAAVTHLASLIGRDIRLVQTVLGRYPPLRQTRPLATVLER